MPGGGRAAPARRRRSSASGSRSTPSRPRPLGTAPPKRGDGDEISFDGDEILDARPTGAAAAFTSHGASASSPDATSRRPSWSSGEGAWGRSTTPCALAAATGGRCPAVTQPAPFHRAPKIARPRASRSPAAASWLGSSRRMRSRTDGARASSSTGSAWSYTRGAVSQSTTGTPASCSASAQRRAPNRVAMATMPGLCARALMDAKRAPKSHAPALASQPCPAPNHSSTSGTCLSRSSTSALSTTRPQSARPCAATAVSMLESRDRVAAYEEATE